METLCQCDASEDSKVTTSEGDVDVNQRHNGTGGDLKSSSKNNTDIAAKNPEIASCIYRQDVVRSKSGGKIGIVTEVAGDSDSNSSGSDVEEEEEEGEEAEANEEGCVDNNEDANAISDDGKYTNCCSLPADQVRVLWMDQSETTQGLNDVTVIDRGFLQGDYVASDSDPTGQVGVVVDVNIFVDLLTPDGSVTSNVSSKDLKRVRDFTIGDYVVLGPWLGRIDDVLDNVTVLFDDGSVCKVTKADPLRLKPVGKNILEDGHFPYYPGQRVKASSSSVFKNSRWLSGLWKANRLEGTVTKVAVGSVFVYWIASAGYGPNSSTTPAEEQSPKNLKLLSCFLHANWQLGDWCLVLPQVKSSSVPLDKFLSNLEPHLDSVKSEVNMQTKSESDSEVLTSDELNGNDEDNTNDGNFETRESNVSAEPSSCSSSLSVLKESVQETWQLHRKKIRKIVIRRDKKARKKEESYERALLIVNTMTRVDVAWQDGTIGQGLDSITLIPIENPGDYDFVSEQYVVEKASDNDESVCEIRRVGVIKCVNAKEKTACVRWLKPVSRAEDPKEFDKEEVVSAYELEGHPDYDYCYGDVVVRLTPVSVPENTDYMGNCAENSDQLGVVSKVGGDEVEGQSIDDSCKDFSDLLWVGNITGLRNGDIEVTWADGMMSVVGPEAIYVVGRDDDDESVAGVSEISDDAASWETVEDDEMDALQISAEENSTEIHLNAEESTVLSENSGSNGALSLPLAAIGFVTRLASGIFSRSRQTAELSSFNSGKEKESLPEEDTRLSLKKDSTDESSLQEPSGIGISNTYIPDDKRQKLGLSEDLDVLDAAEALCNLNSAKPKDLAGYESQNCSFKGFDIAKDPYDNYFLGSSVQNGTERKWLKKVQQDWNILQNNLPDGIYVRVYEDRMDLLRAVIVGAYGTPYQDGLFFFDFHLPPEYPDVPPSAHYHSGGWRLNPNLYEEGKVCLSLLNTWTGKGNEVWDPASSSILQILVSLQGLVLNSKPYFNEAGYDKQIGTAEGEKNSLSYNENTFLLNCKTMMYLMRRPPKDFEDLVKEHFKVRGYYILKACNAYTKGYLIGSLTKDASISEKSIAEANSIGFKLMLAKITPKLFSALNEVGAECDEFKHLQHS